MKRPVHTIILAGLVAVSALAPAFASGGGSGSGGGGGQSAKLSEPMAKAHKLIDAKQWQAAMAELQEVGATRDPMWNNLMGYCLRKNDPPDFAASERYYAAALAINPKHLPTLEYLGELRLQQGDLAGAEKELEQLRKATFFKSEEFKDLQKAIAQYKSAGNKYVPED